MNTDKEEAKSILDDDANAYHVLATLLTPYLYEILLKEKRKGQGNSNTKTQLKERPLMSGQIPSQTGISPSN